MTPAVSIAAVAVAYFFGVFSIGFALGVVRTLWLVPLLGARTAELGELPVMVIVSYFVARFLMNGWGRTLGVAAAAAAGIGALALVAGAELAVWVVIRSQPLADYVAARDPVSGTAFLVTLLLFASMPALAAWSRRGTRADAR